MESQMAQDDHKPDMCHPTTKLTQTEGLVFPLGIFWLIGFTGNNVVLKKVKLEQAANQK